VVNVHGNRRSWRCWHRTRTTLRGKNLWPVSVENHHQSDQVFSSKCGPIVRCQHIQDLLVLQGTTKSTSLNSPWKWQKGNLHTNQWYMNCCLVRGKIQKNHGNFVFYHEERCKVVHRPLLLKEITFLRRALIDPFCIFILFIS